MKSKEKSVVGLSKAKSRGQLVIKKEPKKTLVKTRSRAVLKDKNDPVSVITDDALDVRNNKKKGAKEGELQVVETADEEERLSASVTAVVADHCYTSSPTTSTHSSNPTTSTNCYSTSNQSFASQTPKQSHRVHSRIGFSDVSVFYFDRNIAGCSVPKQGAHTMGMEVKHSHFERRQLGVEEDEEESPHVRRKLFSIPAAAEPEEEAEMAIQMLEWVGEADPRENQMTAVGRLWSQHRPLLPPPKRLASTEGKVEQRSSEDSKVEQQQPVVYSDYRTSRQAESEDSDSDEGGVGGQSSSAAVAASSSRATPAAASSAYKRSLSRAFTTTNLKVQSNDATVSETPSEPLPKPSRKLVSSITTSCLKSFQEFHISPESKAVAAEEVEEEEHDLPVPRPTFARSNSKKFQKPVKVPLERGSSIGKKKSAKKGASGTRGLTPLGERARVSLLRSHGVQNLQGRAEQEELDVLRDSREKCGCSCVGACQPQTCQCALAGIECQVEREGFPCSCGPQCANPEGRREFDETEVSLHYINTMMSMRGVMEVQTTTSSQESLVSAVDIGTF